MSDTKATSANRPKSAQSGPLALDRDELNIPFLANQSAIRMVGTNLERAVIDSVQVELHRPYVCFVPNMAGILRDVLKGKVIELPDSAVLVADIVKSTEMVKRLAAENEDPFERINSIIKPVATSIEIHGGLLIGFRGDNVYAVFSGEWAALRALRVASELEDALRIDQMRIRTDQIRIGLSSGTVKMGALGPEHNCRIEAISPAVNEAFALSNEATEPLMTGNPRGTVVRISEAFADQIFREVHQRESFKVAG